MGKLLLVTALAVADDPYGEVLCTDQAPFSCPPDEVCQKWTINGCNDCACDWPVDPTIPPICQSDSCGCEADNTCPPPECLDNPNCVPTTLSSAFDGGSNGATLGNIVISNSNTNENRTIATNNGATTDDAPTNNTTTDGPAQSSLNLQLVCPGETTCAKWTPDGCNTCFGDFARSLIVACSSDACDCKPPECVPACMEENTPCQVVGPDGIDAFLQQSGAGALVCPIGWLQLQWVVTSTILFFAASLY